MKSVDTILWDDESNSHTLRTIEMYGQLYGTEDKQKLAEKIYKNIQKYDSELVNNINLLDIGCSYGQLMFFLKDKFENSFFVGIDPGYKSIEIAKKNLESTNIKFYQNYSHGLSQFKDNSFDIVVLAMVLQWIPRKYLLQTIAEINRVLKNNGLIFIEEFFPNEPIKSQSKHNSNIYIFKDFYEKYFEVYPWFELINKEILLEDKGFDYRKSICLLKKNSESQSYRYKDFK